MRRTIIPNANPRIAARSHIDHAHLAHLSHPGVTSRTAGIRESMNGYSPLRKFDVNEVDQPASSIPDSAIKVKAVEATGEEKIEQNNLNEEEHPEDQTQSDTKKIVEEHTFSNPRDKAKDQYSNTVTLRSIDGDSQ